MSTTKHTPVPWTRGVCNEIRQGTERIGERFERQRSIATCYPTNGTKEELDVVFANAEFIVQACNAYDELVEQREELRNLVVELEWSGDDGCGACCPVCNGSPDHASDCRLAVLLSKTKGRAE